MERDWLRSERSAVEALAVGLGWFSIGLGAAELLAPRQLARLIGVPANDRNTKVLRTFGAREIASGIAILSQPSNARWLWSRVGGDAADLAALGVAASDESADSRRVAIAAAAVAGVAALDVECARRLNKDDTWPDQVAPDREEAITVRTSFEQTEADWMSWCAIHAADIKDEMVVRFVPAPGARGTEIHVEKSGQRIRELLRRFKQFVETGEVPISDGPGLSRPAQPPADPDELRRRSEVLS
jgi:hypothetical protein